MPSELNDRTDRRGYFDSEFRVLCTVLFAVALASFVFTDDRVNWLLDAIWVAVGPRCLAAAMPLPFLGTKVISGTLNGTCSGRWSARWRP